MSHMHAERGEGRQQARQAGADRGAGEAGTDSEMETDAEHVVRVHHEGLVCPAFTTAAGCVLTRAAR